MSRSRLLTYGQGLKKQDEFQGLGAFIIDWLQDNPAISVQTSGSTGKPKTIVLQKHQMAASAKATVEFFNLNKGTKALHALPGRYIAGKMMFVRAVLFGWDLHIVPPSSSPLKGLKQTFDFAAMVPLQVRASIKDLYRIKTLIIGGAAIPADLENALLEFPTSCWATYGMTETITHIALRKLGEKAYRCLEGIQVHTDQRGCLCIDAPKLNKDVLVTNDLVELHSNVQFVLLGRIDNVINSGGIKIIPEQLEAKLAGKLTTRFFFASQPDKRLGEQLILIVEGEKIVMEAAFFQDFKAFEKPKAVFFIKHFAETPTKKINRLKTMALINNN